MTCLWESSTIRASVNGRTHFNTAQHSLQLLCRLLDAVAVTELSSLRC